MMTTTIHDDFFGLLEFSNDAELLDSLEDGSLKNKLVRAIDSLPESARMLMGMIYQQEMNPREICAVLNVGESCVARLHSEALALLCGGMNGY